MLAHRRITPSIKFAGNHLYTWVERGTVRVKWALSIRPKIPEIPGLGANGTDIFRNFIPKFWVYLERLA